IGRGEKVEPLKIKTGDEIELLSEEINTMNRLLRKSFTGLEDQVREKTKEIRYLQAYTESILKSVPDVLIIFNEELKIEYTNTAFETLTGISASKVLGQELQEMDIPSKDRWEFLAHELKTF
ncbi:MAG: PAS domain S-box protein, partial [Nitrospinaceae bacterium]|nr:PAS domain S-box protein [Nitrospinaceae bacterium]NIR56565.1 PAS domain S-box protein [Nitrospinaceae bacterium]NIS87027.1 PAS domain S-box protein [Nitrospinaceae bacterium]NIT83871.1 PAS domain S-box protein [Nitrospinaceae bacterium]NIU46074.1 PAS domain S-box protein [Nitrospinaceae bacterium]